jgi:predicted nucleic acid-binding protein
MTGAWVVDASVAIKWVLSEADSGAALKLQGARLIAPELLDLECANILWKAARRGELDAEEVRARQSLLAEAPVERLPVAPLLPAALRHALRLDHPVHDCVYIETALLCGVPLVTADRRLARLAEPGVEILGLDDLS